MKKLIVICLVLCIVFTLVSCSKKDDDVIVIDTTKKETSKVENDYRTETEIESELFFELPAKSVQIDTTAKDPTSDAMWFKYDDMGRVTRCYYNVIGAECCIAYEYTDTQVKVVGYYGPRIMTEETFDLPGTFNPEKPFVEYQGYYFNGYDFK